jgi:hypothetical protein
VTGIAYHHPGIDSATLPFVSATGGRTLSPEESDRVRAELVRLRDQFKEAGKNQTELAAWIGQGAGTSISQQTVSHIINGGQAGTKFARALAKRLGVSFELLVGGEAKGAGELAWGLMPAWQAAELEARRLHKKVPEFAWRLAREMKGAHPPSNIDPETVFTFAKAWLDIHTDEDIKRVMATEAQIAAEEARAEELEHAQGELPIESRDPPPPPKKKRGSKQRTPTPAPTSAVVEKKSKKTSAKANPKQGKLSGV